MVAKKDVPIEQSKLYVSTTPYKIQKSRKEGEIDLADLAKISELEGGWLFSPLDKMWYNATQRTEQSAISRLVTMEDEGYIALGKQLSHYHIHPKCIEKPLLNLCHNIASFGASLLDPKYFNNFAAAFSSLPSSTKSGGDIAASEKVIKLNPDCDLDFRITTSYGTVTLNFLDKKVKSAYEDANMNCLRNQKLLEEDTPEKAIENVVSQINREMQGKLELSFSPHKL